MTLTPTFKIIVVTAISGLCLSAQAAGILQPGDTIYGIDLDVGATPTSPATEGAVNILDGNSGTKYLNGGNNWSGFIVTPGVSTVQSIRFTTANDSINRDPAYYALYGTTDAITSTAQGRGLAESWTLITSGSVSLPTTRLDSTTVVSFGNAASYSSYKLLFPATRSGGDANMQIADVQFYTEAAGAGATLLSSANPIVPVDLTGAAGSSRHPAAENPGSLLDGNTATKYLNFGEINSGFIVVPQSGPSVVGSIQLWTANDAVERDPAGYALFGMNGTVDPLSLNNTGDGPWTLISSGALTLPTDRFAAGGEVWFANDQTYDAYRFIVTSVRDEATANSMQFSNFELYLIPEPSALSLMGVGVVLVVGALRRRRD